MSHHTWIPDRVQPSSQLNRLHFLAAFYIHDPFLKYTEISCKSAYKILSYPYIAGESDHVIEGNENRKTLLMPVQNRPGLKGGSKK